MKGEMPGVSLEVYDPAGIIEIAECYAPRLANLSGKTICELSNFIWEYHRTFPVIRGLLQRRFPDMKIIPHTEFPILNTYQTEPDVLLKLLREKGCDGVIVGNAA